VDSQPTLFRPAPLGLNRIWILRYERACNQYEEVVRPLSGHIGLALPIGSIAPRVRARPLPPQTTELDPEVDLLCRKLWDSFEGCPES
jgi:hypothetical protein